MDAIHQEDLLINTICKETHGMTGAHEMNNTDNALNSSASLAHTSITSTDEGQSYSLGQTDALPCTYFDDDYAQPMAASTSIPYHLSTHDHWHPAAVLDDAVCFAPIPEVIEHSFVLNNTDEAQVHEPIAEKKLMEQPEHDMNNEDKTEPLNSNATADQPTVPSTTKVKPGCIDYDRLVQFIQSVIQVETDQRTLSTTAPHFSYQDYLPSMTSKKKLMLYLSDDTEDETNMNDSSQKSTERAIQRELLASLCTDSKVSYSASVQLNKECLLQLMQEGVFWIDLDKPTTDDLALIAEIFRLHPLTLEDLQLCFPSSQSLSDSIGASSSLAMQSRSMEDEMREKCDLFDRYIFICTKTLSSLKHSSRSTQSMAYVSNGISNSTHYASSASDGISNSTQYASNVSYNTHYDTQYASGQYRNSCSNACFDPNVLPLVIIACPECVLTIHAEPLALSAQLITKRIHHLGQFSEASHAWITYAILESIANDFSLWLRHLGRLIEGLDDDLMQLADGCNRESQESQSIPMNMDIHSNIQLVNYDAMYSRPREQDILTGIRSTRRLVTRMMRLLKPKAEIISVLSKRARPQQQVQQQVHAKLKSQIALPSIPCNSQTIITPPNCSTPFNHQRTISNHQISRHLGNTSNHLASVHQRTISNHLASVHHQGNTSNHPISQHQRTISNHLASVHHQGNTSNHPISQHQRTISISRHPIVDTIKQEEPPTQYPKAFLSNWSFLNNDFALYLHDLKEHVHMLDEYAQYYDDALNRCYSNYLAHLSVHVSQASNLMNRTMQQLAGIAAVVIPLSLITSLLSTNLPTPFQKNTDSREWIPFGVMVVGLIGLTSWLYLRARERRWLD